MANIVELSSVIDLTSKNEEFVNSINNMTEDEVMEYISAPSHHMAYLIENILVRNTTENTENKKRLLEYFAKVIIGIEMYSIKFGIPENIFDEVVNHSVEEMFSIMAKHND